MEKFLKASRGSPCPVCGKPDWCIVSKDGGTAICYRVPSDRPRPDGGFVHILKRTTPTRPAVPRKRPSARVFDAERAQESFAAEFAADPSSMDFFQEDVWIMDADAVRRMHVGRSKFHGAWTFPMRDGAGKVVGIRLREYGSSRKWAVPGSHDGLFYDPDMEVGRTVVNGLPERELVVVEGPTDCIAGWEIGLNCVGRASCNTGAAHIMDLCRRWRITLLTVVADNDLGKARISPCGAPMRSFRPGIEGAERLAAECGRKYRIVIPPRKDLREWVYAGEAAITGAEFKRVADMQKIRS